MYLRTARVGAIGPAGGYFRFFSKSIGTIGLLIESDNAISFLQLAERLYFKVIQLITT
jgi:hypothetical protein